MPVDTDPQYSLEEFQLYLAIENAKSDVIDLLNSGKLFKFEGRLRSKDNDAATADGFRDNVACESKHESYCSFIPSSNEIVYSS